VARSTCRRAERAVIALSEVEAINPEGLKFLNRFSDYLFVLCRAIADVQNLTEVLWEKDHLV
jgi:cob(I)alamin adenosyltransferase